MLKPFDFDFDISPLTYALSSRPSTDISYKANARSTIGKKYLKKVLKLKKSISVKHISLQRSANQRFGTYASIYTIYW